LGRGRTKVGDRNFPPQLTPSLCSSPLKRGRKLGRGIPSKKGRRGGYRWGSFPNKGRKEGGFLPPNPPPPSGRGRI